MSGTLQDVRALIVAIERSPWREIYVRTGGWSVFLAKPGGGPNPLRAPAAAVAARGDSVDVAAAHLGLFTSCLPVGTAVTAGSVVGLVEVLGSFTEVTSDMAGIIESVLADEGALVEYGAPLVRILPA
jgi:biotin carboxyl carrier protein